MGIEVKKREGESAGTLIYRFTKKIQRSGVLREARKRRFHDRSLNRRKIRLSALYRGKKKEEYLKAKKLGTL
jgi:ribosomal protein S21